MLNCTQRVGLNSSLAPFPRSRCAGVDNHCKSATVRKCAKMCEKSGTILRSTVPWAAARRPPGSPGTAAHAGTIYRFSLQHAPCSWYWAVGGRGVGAAVAPTARICIYICARITITAHACTSASARRAAGHKHVCLGAGSTAAAAATVFTVTEIFV